MLSEIMRSATPGDVAAISDLTRSAYSKWVALIGREPLPMKVNYDQAIKEHDFDLLEQDGLLLGLIETTAENDALLIVNVAIRPEHQGRGLGKRLLQYAETRAGSAGLSRTRLYTNKLFAENLSLYASIGYKVDREEALNGGIAVHMSKRLF